MKTELPTPTPTAEQPQTRWLTIKQFQDYVDIGAERQFQLRKAKAIPFYKINKRILYDINEIDAWIIESKVV